MANQRWVSGASSVAQSGTITYATYNVLTTYGVLIGSKAITQIGTGGTITVTIAALYALINASTEPEYLEYTWTNPSPGVIQYTANTAGKSGTVTGTVSGGTGTQTPAAVTANSGPSVFDIAGNWTSAQPGAGDTGYWDNSAIPLLYDLSQAGATLTKGVIAQSFTGQIGLPKLNKDAQPYTEYRPDYLALDCSAWDVGTGPGQGSGRIKIKSGTVQTLVNVNGTGFGLETNLEAFLWIGTHASNVMNVRGNSQVGIAVFGGEVATLLTLGVDAGRVRCGSGVTLGTITVNGGSVELNCAVGTAITVNAGNVIINGSGAVAQLTILGGNVVYNSSGTLGGNTTIGGNGSLTFDQDPRAKAITNAIALYGPSCRLSDTYKVTTGFVFSLNEGAKMSQINGGQAATFTRS